MRRHPLLQKLLTLVLVIGLLPGLNELFETAEHLLQTGHMPHSAEHDVVQISEDQHEADEEHDCTPMAHHCACHASAPALLADSVTVEPPALAMMADTRAHIDESIALMRANAPPTRPPIA